MIEGTISESSTALGASSQARTKALVLGILTGLGSRVLILAAPLLTIPVTLRYLGPEIFGFWMTVASISAMAMFADLGLGNGLLTRLASCAANRDYVGAKGFISTAYLSLTGIAVGLMALVMLIVPSLDWATLLNLNEDVDAAAVRTVAVLCLSAFVVTIPLSLVQRVQYAFGDAWKSNVWQVAGAVFTVVAVYAAAVWDAGYGIIISAAVFSSPFVMLLNSLFYYWRHKKVRPGFRSVSLPIAGSLLRVGLGFLVLSVLTSLSLNVDNVIVATVADLRAVSDFSITTKLFSLLGMAITLVALPLWPANGEAIASGDSSWVQRTTRKMVLFSVVLVGISGGVLVVSRNLIAGFWIGEEHTISLALALNLVLWSTLMAFASPLFSVQNSVGVLRYQFVGWFLFLALSVPLKIYFYSLLGLSGIPLAGAVAYLTLLCPVALIGYRATLRGVGERVEN